MATFTVETTINAPIGQVWSVLADIGSIATWHPGVTHSYLLSEEGGGLRARRHCDLGGGNYLQEQVVAWEVERHLSFRIISTSLPFNTADIQFTLARSGDGTIVTVSPVYTLKFGIVGRLIDYFMVRRQYEAGMRQLLFGLKNAVEGNSMPRTMRVHDVARQQGVPVETDGARSQLLQVALAANSIFSGISGITMSLASARIANLLGVDESLTIEALGVSLLLFAAILAYVARRPAAYTGIVATAVGLDLLWVGATAVLITTGELTVMGTWVLALIADVVLALAILQALGLRRLPRQLSS